MAPVVLLFAVLLAVDPMAFEQPALKEGVLLVLAPLLLFRSAWNGHLRRLVAAPLCRPLLAFAGWFAAAALAACFLAQNRHDAFEAVAVLFVYLLVALLVHERSWERPLELPVALLLTGVVAGGVAVLQAFGCAFPFDAGGAAVSLFGNTNLTGEYLAPLVPLALVLGAGLRGAPRLLAAAALPLLVAGLVLAKSRGALLAAGVGILLAPFLARGHVAAAVLRLRGGLLLAAGVLLAVAAGGAGTFRLDTIEGGADAGVTSLEYPSNRQRLLLLEASLEMTRAAPLLGHGPGSFRAAFPPYRDPAEAAIPTLGGARSAAEDPHDQYVLLLAEGGIVALLLFLGFVGPALLAYRFAALLPEDDVRRPVAPALAAGLVAFLVVALFRSPLEHPPSALVFVGLTAALLPYRDGTLGGGRSRFGAFADRLLPLYLLGVFLLGVRALGGDLLLAWSQRARATAHARQDPRYLGDADRLLRFAARVDPADFLVLQVLADGLEKGIVASADRLGEAIAVRRQILARYPHHALSLVNLAALHLHRGDPAAARPLLARAASLRAADQPEDPVLLLAESGKHEAAIRLLAHQVERGEAARERFLEMASAADQQGRHGAAAAGYQAFLELRPYDGDVAFRAGQLARDAGREDEATEWFARSHVAFALEALGQRQYEDAARQVKLARRDRDSVEADVLDALVALANGDPQPLAELRERAPALDEPFVQALRRLEANGDLRDALRRLTGSR